MRNLPKFILASAFLALSGAAASGADMTAKEMTSASAKVQTAVALAKIARETNDGDAMLVAARLMASAGPVAMSGSGADGKPAVLYDVAQMAADAKAMGADAAKADMVATRPVSNIKPTSGHWETGCNDYNYCNTWWVED